MKPPVMLTLAALSLLAGCYTSPGYFGGGYGYGTGSLYYSGFGYPYGYNDDRHRHSDVRLYKHSRHKLYAPRQRFHRPNLNPRFQFGRTIGGYRGSDYHRVKHRSFTGDRYSGSGRRFNRDHIGTSRKFRGNRFGNGRYGGQGSSLGRGFR